MIEIHIYGILSMTVFIDRMSILGFSGRIIEYKPGTIRLSIKACKTSQG